MTEKLLNVLRGLLYPALDLHTRNRASVSRFWKGGACDVLDAGSENLYFSWLEYNSGARVVALNFNGSEVEKAKEFLLDYRKADPASLAEQLNLLLGNSQRLKEAKGVALKVAEQTFCWEKQAPKILRSIETALRTNCR